MVWFSVVTFHIFRGRSALIAFRGKTAVSIQVSDQRRP